MGKPSFTRSEVESRVKELYDQDLKNWQQSQREENRILCKMYGKDFAPEPQVYQVNYHLILLQVSQEFGIAIRDFDLDNLPNLLDYVCEKLQAESRLQ